LRLRICLASGSPRRRELLLSIGISPIVVVPSVPEVRQPAERAEGFVRRLAREKGEAVLSELEPGEWLIIAADTVVVLGEEVLGKPGTEAAAEWMLEKLSGKTHRVLTGLALLCTQKMERSISCTQTLVRFRELDSDSIRRYVTLDNVSDCAGGYRIQGRGVALLDGGISGSYSNVVGLPLERLFLEAGKLGVDLLKI